MKQSQFYKYTTWGLLVLNIAILGFFFLTGPKHGPMGNPPDIQSKLIKNLMLDSDQEKMFKEYATEHNMEMRKLSAEQKELLQPYFESLYDKSEPGVLDSILSRIENIERNKIEVTYLHFQEVESLLTEDQKGQFKGFVKEALGSVLKTNEEKRPPRSHKK